MTDEPVSKPDEKEAPWESWFFNLFKALAYTLGAMLLLALIVIVGKVILFIIVTRW